MVSDNLRRGCRLQDGGAVQGRSESGWRVIAHRHGGREARLAWGGIREHYAFLGHEMRGPAGTGRSGVSMAGGWEGQGASKGNGVKRLRQIGAESRKNQKTKMRGSGKKERRKRERTKRKGGKRRRKMREKGWEEKEKKEKKEGGKWV